MSTIAERNAAHAAVVRSWLDESLAFSALEMAVTDLDAIRNLCDAACFELSKFSALDEVVLASGESEQAAQAKRARVDPEGGLDEPLDGEQGWAVLDINDLECDPVRVCTASGAYFMLFDRPLLALGAFRHAHALDPSCIRAVYGMASCLESVGRRVAAARLALAWFTDSKRGIHNPMDDAAGNLLFVLADGADLLSVPASPHPLLGNIHGFLSKGAASAVRSLLRRWLSSWLPPEDGLAGLLCGVDRPPALFAADLMACRK